MELITTIVLKSDRYVYYKEISGNTNNTIRIVSQKEDELLKNKLDNIKYIKIVGSFILSGSLPQSFTRTIKDITRWEQKNIIIYIFTWEDLKNATTKPIL